MRGFLRNRQMAVKQRKKRGHISKSPTTDVICCAAARERAFVADNGNAPPTSAWQLTIIKKTTQEAAN